MPFQEIRSEDLTNLRRMTRSRVSIFESPDYPLLSQIKYLYVLMLLDNC